MDSTIELLSSRSAGLSVQDDEGERMSVITGISDDFQSHCDFFVYDFTSPAKSLSCSPFSPLFSSLSSTSFFASSFSVLYTAAMELKKLPAKKKLLSQLKQQNAIQNQQPPSISVIPLSSQQAHTTTATKMDQDDDEIVTHDDDSPLDMRITKQPDSDELRPSVIRKPH